MSVCMKNTVNKLFVIPPKISCRRRISIALRNKSMKRVKILRSEFCTSVYYKQEELLCPTLVEECVDIASEQHASEEKLRHCSIGQ